MTPYEREAEMYPRITGYLRRKGYVVHSEVRPRPGSPRRIDVAGVQRKTGQVVAVEAKLAKFNRLLEQALQRLFVADLVYVSAPPDFSKRILNDHVDRLLELGIGLLRVGPTVRQMLPARPSRNVNPRRRERLRAILEEKPA